MNVEEISKSECASRWKVGKSTISGYLKRGMPANANGKLNWNEVQRWRRAWIVPELSGNPKFRNRRGALNESTEGPNVLPGHATVPEAVAALHGAGMRSLVAVGKALDLPQTAQRALIYIACSWLWSVLGEAVMLSCGENGPVVDYSGLDGPRLTASQTRASDGLIDRAEKALENFS